VSYLRKLVKYRSNTGRPKDWPQCPVNPKGINLVGEGHRSDSGRPAGAKLLKIVSLNGHEKPISKTGGGSAPYGERLS